MPTSTSWATDTSTMPSGCVPRCARGIRLPFFPEGTRTYSGAMKRFHKGAFYLAETLQLDILPVVLYGNGQIIAKAQPFNIRRGVIRTEALATDCADRYKLRQHLSGAYQTHFGRDATGLCAGMYGDERTGQSGILRSVGAELHIQRPRSKSGTSASK